MFNDDEKSKIKAFLLKIRTDHFYQVDNFPTVLHNPRYEFSVGSNYYMMGLKGSKALSEINDILFRDSTISENYSRRTMTRELQGLIAKIIDSQSPEIEKYCKECLETFLNELEHQNLMRWQIITPVVNLLLVKDPLQVGKVTFRKNNKAIIEEFKNIAKDTNSPPEVKNYISDNLVQRFDNKVLAFIEIDAKDKYNALELAHTEIDTALNVLRFYSRGTQKNDSISYRMFIAREGLVFQGQTLSLFSNKTEGDSTPSFNLEFARTGYLYEYLVDDEIFNRMNTLSFNILNDMLMKDRVSLTDLEKKILDAINMFGRGMYKMNSENSYINFIISVELILTNKWEPQKGLIAERVAMLIGKDVNEKKELFGEIERLYQLRSDFIHQGDDRITDSDLSILSYLVFQVIVRLILVTKKIDKFADLIEKFNTTKFSLSFD